MIRVFAFAIAGGLALAAPARAEPGTVLVIKDHLFEPQVLSIPAGTKVTVTVHNAGTTPAEFESADLNREKLVAAGHDIQVIVGPLPAGTYKFFDDFHPDTTGRIEVK